MAVLNRTAPALGRGRHVNIPALGILAAGLVGAAALLPVAQTSNATSTGSEIRRLEAEKTAIKARLYTQEAGLADLGSLDRVDRRAKELGMVPAERWMYVTVSDRPPAATVPVRYLTEQPRAAVKSEARPWWRSLLSQLPWP